MCPRGGSGGWCSSGLIKLIVSPWRQNRPKCTGRRDFGASSEHWLARSRQARMLQDLGHDGTDLVDRDREADVLCRCIALGARCDSRVHRDDQSGRIDQCGEAEDRHEALVAVPAKHPQLVIIDLTLKNSDGLELIKDIRSRWPKLRMLVVSMHDESLYAERAIRAGALGYITKQEATRKILIAVRRVLEGTIYLNEKIASHIISRLTSHAGAVAATPDELLSDRELQVFDLTGRGQNTVEIR